MLERPVDIRRQLSRALAVFIIVIIVGALGYYFIERVIEQRNGWTLLDSFYMAVITVSTVGYREVHEPGPLGRMFTIVLIFFGVGAFMYLVTAVANYVITGELQGFRSRRRMEKQIAQVSDHFIVCAYGRMGSEVAQDFAREHLPVVVVDTSEEALSRARDDGHLVVLGDAGDDEVLRQAGVERAHGLVSCLDNDAGNLMVVLSARALNERLLIVSRTNLHETTSKLRVAGANRVLWPYGLSGRRMAQMAVRPNVVEFLEVVMHDEELELLLEELTLAFGSELEGQEIGSGVIRNQSGAMVVAIRRRDGKMFVAPSAKTTLAAGDIIVALGTREQLSKLARLAHGGPSQIEGPNP